MTMTLTSSENKIQRLNCRYSLPTCIWKCNVLIFLSLYSPNFLLWYKVPILFPFTFWHDVRHDAFIIHWHLKDQGTFIPVGAQRGTPKKTIFLPEFCNEICTIYAWTIQNHNSEKKNQNVVPFQNGGQITDFYFASFQFWPKFEKPLSQRNFSIKFGSE